jgi:hypothetical protein
MIEFFTQEMFVLNHDYLTGAKRIIFLYVNFNSLCENIMQIVYGSVDRGSVQGKAIQK